MHELGIFSTNSLFGQESKKIKNGLLDSLALQEDFKQVEITSEFNNRLAVETVRIFESPSNISSEKASFSKDSILNYYQETPVQMVQFFRFHC